MVLEKNLSIKETPLKRIYYGKYKFKMVVNSPKKKNTNSKKVKINPEYKKYLKTQKLLNEKYGGEKSNFNYDLFCGNYYCWFGVKTNQYQYKTIFYFNDENKMLDYFNKLKPWVSEIEKPLSEKHIDKLSKEIDIQYVVRDKPFKDKFTYKTIIYAWTYINNNDSVSKKFKELKKLFNIENNENSDILIIQNCYSITIYTNRHDYLILLQLASDKKLTIQKFINPSELVE